MGPRGDAVVEADWCVGEILSYLRKKGLLENTLVIFTSDNGPVLNDGYADGAVEMLGSHDPMNGMRGGKYSLFDGGTHVPFIVAWDGKVKPGTSDAFISQMDLYPSLGQLAGVETPSNLDGEPLLETLLGKSDEGREMMVLEAQGRLAYKRGSHVLIPPYGGRKTNSTGNELGNLPDWSLFDLKDDPAQKEDMADDDRALLEEMKALFEEAIHTNK